MDAYEYQVIMAKIREIEHEQLSWLEYVCDKINVIVDEQKARVQERLMQLWEEKLMLQIYKNS